MIEFLKATVSFLSPLIMLNMIPSKKMHGTPDQLHKKMMNFDIPLRLLNEITLLSTTRKDALDNGNAYDSIRIIAAFKDKLYLSACKSYVIF